MPQPPLWHGPHRLVVRTSRCGRDNPGSTPGVDIFLPRNQHIHEAPTRRCHELVHLLFVAVIRLVPTGHFGQALDLTAHGILKRRGSGCYLHLNIQRRQRWISAAQTLVSFVFAPLPPRKRICFPSHLG